MNRYRLEHRYLKLNPSEWSSLDRSDLPLLTKAEFDEAIAADLDACKQFPAWGTWSARLRNLDTDEVVYEASSN